MDQKPKIPTLRDSQKPQVRIKGLAARLSFVERLKQFKKKDLAFILAGLGVLFMAPLAEHFMMSPENADTGNTLSKGWSFSPNGGRFGDGASPYESGVNGMAPGSNLGAGGDVITPLNVRDPSALVMGPGASQQPAATSTTPPPPAKENTDWKDAIANAASKGASTATKAASLPVPKTSLTNAGLRGLGVASGGGGATWNPPPISASNVPNRGAAGSNMAGVNKAPGYIGVGQRGSKSGSTGLEQLKKMAEKAGSDINRQGNAATNLEQAAGRGMPGGSGDGGDGQGRSGKDDKGGGNNSGKDSKSLGESLAFLAAKENQQKAIDLYWKLKEKDAMLWPNLKEKILEEAVMTPMKALTKGVTGMFDDFGSDKNSYIYKCATGGPFPFGSVASDCKAETLKTATKCFQDGNIYAVLGGNASQPPIGTKCEKAKGAGDSPASSAEQVAKDQKVDPTNPLSGPTGSGGISGLNDKLCKDMDGVSDAEAVKVSKFLAEAFAGVMAANNAMYGNARTMDCGKTPVASIVSSANLETQLKTSNDKYVKEGYNKLIAADGKVKGNVDALKAGESKAVSEDVTTPLKTVPDTLDLAKAKLTELQGKVDAWNDAKVCGATCAQNDPLADTGRKEAKALFEEGAKAIPGIQDGLKQSVAELNKAQKSLDTAKGALGSYKPATDWKMDFCSSKDTKECFGKYVETAQSRINESSKRACGTQNCSPDGQNAVGGLQKNAADQLSSMQKGSGNEGAGTSEKLLNNNKYARSTGGSNAEGVTEDYSLNPFKGKVKEKLALPDDVTEATWKAKWTEISTNVDGESTKAQGYDTTLSGKVDEHIKALGTLQLCGGKGGDACAPQGGASAQ